MSPDPMSFVSLLDPFAEGPPPSGADDPDCFGDLHLDAVVDGLVAGREGYELRGWFQQPPTDEATLRYRHAVMADLQRPEVAGSVRSFSRAMRGVREDLARSRSIRHRPQSRRFALDALSGYAEAVVGFSERLAGAELRSEGLSGFAGHLAAYVADPGFVAMTAEADRLEGQIGAIRYRLTLQGNKIRVERDEDRADYAAEVAACFERFRVGEVTRRHPSYAGRNELDHVQAQVLDAVCRLFPEVFGDLDRLAERYEDFVAAPVSRFEREVQVYLCYLERMEALGAHGLAFCFPELVDEGGEEHATDTFDLALALGGREEAIVVNSFRLSGPERILVVSGPNQGGKTTFARTFGQLHHLASIGLPVPGTSVQLVRSDAVYSHFEREELMVDLRGKLQDDLERAHAILDAATARSALVLNELFASTTLDDARLLGRRILAQVGQLGAVAVYVTFVEELATLDERTVSMVAGVDPTEPSRRTFRIERRAPDGRAYAQSIAERYGLGYDTLRARLRA